MLIEVVVQIADDFYLFLDDLRKHPILDRKQPSHPRTPILYFGLNAHPQRHSSDHLQHNTP